MNRLLKFLYRFQNQRRIHTWASFWTVVKMAWAQSGRTDNDDLIDDNYTIVDIESIQFGVVPTVTETDDFIIMDLSVCNHEYEYSNGIRKCLKCGKENRYYLEV